MEPTYLSFSQTDWQDRKEKATELLRSCKVCPHCCGVNRLAGEIGRCGSGVLVQKDKSFDELSCLESSLIALKVALLHKGEEPVFGGATGVGNFFFYYCNGRCVFCQNWEISQPQKPLPATNYFSKKQLAQKMISLQQKGATHIGLVSPTHIAPFLIPVIQEAALLGLSIPIIYNSNGYERRETLSLFDGIVSVYLPDFKYGEDEAAKIYSGFNDYNEHALKAIKEMVKQVGTTLILEGDIAKRGIIVRHLVMPNEVSSSNKVFEQLSQISTAIPISLMAQYSPCYKAETFSSINRGISSLEYENAKKYLEQNLFYKGWEQNLESKDYYLPNFGNSENIFS